MATRKRTARASGRSIQKTILEGMPELIEALETVASQMSGDAIKEALIKRIGIPLRDEARRRVPEAHKRGKHTGNLKRGIFTSKGDSNKLGILVGVNYRIAPHAHLVEFGHGGPKPAGPKPFMRPAVDSMRGQILSEIEAIYRETLKEFSK